MILQSRRYSEQSLSTSEFCKRDTPVTRETWLAHKSPTSNYISATTAQEEPATISLLTASMIHRISVQFIFSEAVEVLTGLRMHRPNTVFPK
jgi:hypothetical protein